MKTSKRNSTTPIQREPSGRQPRHKTPHGTQTREHILDCAIEVLSTRGAVGFSTHRVAGAAKISLGNLTYYFPRRRDLIHAMAERLIDKYARQFEDTCTRLAGQEDIGLDELIDWLLDDAVSPATTHVFPELWAMANHHPDVAESLDHIYDGAVRGLLRAMRVEPDAVAAADLRACAYLLGCVSEGCTAIFGRAGPTDARFIATKQRARRVLLACLQEALRKAQVAP